MIDSDLVEELVGFGFYSSSRPKPQAIYYSISIPMRCSEAFFIETDALFIDLLLFVVYFTGLVQLVTFKSEGESI